MTALNGSAKAQRHFLFQIARRRCARCGAGLQACVFFVSSWLIAGSAAAQQAKEVKFFSEAVQCYAKIHTPKGFTSESKAAAVVLAPAPGDTAASIDKYAAQLAARGMVAMVIDYRGWGKSGGFLYLAEPIRWDDRLRFSQHTARMRVRRGRKIPNAQILDIRNAISYLQGEPGVDRARIGLWGAGLAGGHVVVTAGVDFRVKAAVAQTPIIDGQDTPRKATKPAPAQHAAMVRLARTGQAPATAAAALAMNDEEGKLALAEYHPFWYVDQISQTTAILFVVAEKDAKVKNATNAVAASKLLKGPNGVTTIPGATHGLATPQAFDAAVEAAVAWFQKYL
jgi:dienelactone hydrolase